MSTYQDYLADIADAIREKDGTSSPILASDFAERIRAIPSGGGGAFTVLSNVIQPEINLLFTGLNSPIYLMNDLECIEGGIPYSISR